MLLQEKKNYYDLNNDDDSLIEIEEKKIMNLKKAKIDFKGLYYSLDGHNFFKRVDRYYNKKLIFPFFIYATFFNLFEIVLNIILLTYLRKQPNEYSKGLLIISIIFFISSSVNSPALLLGSILALTATIRANLLPTPRIVLKAKGTFLLPSIFVFNIRRMKRKSCSE